VTNVERRACLRVGQPEQHPALVTQPLVVGAPWKRTVPPLVELDNVFFQLGNAHVAARTSNEWTLIWPET
jgi:hypothetical protein